MNAHVHACIPHPFQMSVIVTAGENKAIPSNELKGLIFIYFLIYILAYHVPVLFVTISSTLFFSSEFKLHDRKKGTMTSTEQSEPYPVYVLNAMYKNGCNNKKSFIKPAISSQVQSSRDLFCRNFILPQTLTR